MKFSARALALFVSLVFWGCGDGDVLRLDAPDCVQCEQPYVVECTVLGVGDCSQANLDFGDVLVGTRAERKILLRNLGDAPVKILEEARGALPSAFDHSLLCEGDECSGHLIEAKRSLEVVVGFAPDEHGAFEATLVHEALGSIRLRGSGRGPLLYCEVEADFGRVPVGEMVTRTLRCFNDGDHAQVIGAFVEGTNAADFRLLGAATQKAHPGSSAAFQVQFAPGAVGPRVATLRFQVGEKFLQAAALTAEGLAHPLVFADEGCVDFGFTKRGTKRTRSIMVENLSASAVRLAGASTTGAGFAIRSAPISIPAGDQATIEVDFEPLGLGKAEGALLLDLKSGRDPRTSICLEGTGGGPELVCDATEVDFGLALVGVPETITLSCSNGGEDVPGTTEDNLRLALGPLASPFGASIVGDAPAAGYGVGEPFEIRFTYEPASLGEDQASLEISSNDALQPSREVPISGHVIASSDCQLEVSPTALDFGSVWRDRLTLPLRLRNVGPSDCLVTDFEIPTSAPFSVDAPAPKALTPGEMAFVEVTFEAAGVTSAASSQMQFLVDSAASPQRHVSLSGSNAGSCLKVRPGELDFGVVPQGCSSNALELRLVNDCDVDVEIVGIGLDRSSGFELLGDVPASVPARRSALLAVRPSAGSAGLRKGMLSIETVAHGKTIVPLAAEAEDEPLATDLHPAKTGKVDILIIQDNSAGTEYWNWLHAETFVQEAAARDFQIGVTTTGLQPVENPGCNGGVDGGENGRLFPADGSNPRIITPSMPTADQANLLEQNTNVGDCHASEAGLEAMRRALSPPLVDRVDDPRHPEWNDGNLGFLRDEADLEVLVYSDEGDGSQAPPEIYTEFLRGRKDDPSRARLHAIVGDHLEGCSGSRPGGGVWSAQAGIGYAQVVEATDGVHHSYCSFHPEPEHNARLVSGLYGRRCYDLRGRPADRDGDGDFADDIYVHAGGIVYPSGGALPWTYEADRNRICFTTDARPARTSDVEISYTPACMP